MLWHFDQRGHIQVGAGPVEPEPSEPTPVVEDELKARYLAWRRTHDYARAYAEIGGFVETQMSRGQLLGLMDAVTGYKGT